MPAPTPVEPDYLGPCVAGLVPALLAAAHDELPDWIPAPARGAETVVVLVLDGLGWEVLAQRSELMPTLAAMPGGPITTVTPATTASALTSITTGLPPGVHGLTGFRIRYEDDVLNVLSWQTGTRRRPRPVDVQRRAAFGGREVPALTRSEYRASGFTEAHLRGARFIGWSTTAVLCEQVARLAHDGEPLVFAYYPGVDVVAHEFGLHDSFYERELAATDALVASMLRAMPAQAALLVTSDHGQVHMDPETAWVELGELGDLVDLQAGDARFRHLYARRGARDDLLAGAVELMGERGWVVTRSELVERGWLGPEVARPALGRVGDVVLAPADAIGFVDPALPRERNLRSAHGSLTAQEMLVPLVGARGESER